MKFLSKALTGLRKGLEFLEKTRRVLQSVEIVSKHLSAMTDDLETVWGKEKPEPVEEAEV